MLQFSGSTKIPAYVAFLGQRINLKSLEGRSRLAYNPLTIATGRDGIAVVFRYGVIVCFGLGKEEVNAFTDEIQLLISEPVASPETDSIDVILNAEANEGMSVEGIVLNAFSLQRLQVVADVLAKSVVLGHYEVNLARYFDRVEPLAHGLGYGYQPELRGRDLLRYIGDTLSIESKMIGRVEVSEKPEVIWEYPENERLYLRLEDEYELSERHDAIDRKLALLSKTAVTLLDILQTRRSLRVEWYIVILIVAEIAITIGEKIL